jgi:hypothetical protein
MLGAPLAGNRPSALGREYALDEGSAMQTDT